MKITAKIQPEKARRDADGLILLTHGEFDFGIDVRLHTTEPLNPEDIYTVTIESTPRPQTKEEKEADALLSKEEKKVIADAKKAGADV